MRNKKILLLLIFCLIFFLLTGCNNNTNLNMESKIEAEIEFAENRILLFLKNSEYDEYLEDSTLNWEKIENDTNQFVNSFPIIEADLSNVQYSQNQIDEIKNNLNSITNNLKNRNFQNLKNEYGNLYLKIINIKNNKNKDLKNKCMKIYIQALNENKNVADLIAEIENDYKKNKNDYEFVNINKYSMNKIYDNIVDLKKGLKDNEFNKIRAHSLKIIEIM
ncbi:MAG: hypothetical protein J6J60_07130 [Clostridia bacterium]|nr:hypothetical protein [Clostridia bacterium]